MNAEPKGETYEVVVTWMNIDFQSMGKGIWGPFTDRMVAERCMVALASREGVGKCVIVTHTGTL